jgi:thioredoxin reductase
MSSRDDGGVADAEVIRELTVVGPDPWASARRSGRVPGYARVRARDLVAELARQSLGQFAVPVHLDTTAEQVDLDGEVVRLSTSAGVLRSRAVILAGGHGAFEPRRLATREVDLGRWEGRGVRYLIADKAELAGARVVLVGGGDSALDWALDLLDTAAEVHLVHRREDFRGHEHAVARVREAARHGLCVCTRPTPLAACEATRSCGRSPCVPSTGASRSSSRWTSSFRCWAS